MKLPASFDWYAVRLPSRSSISDLDRVQEEELPPCRLPCEEPGSVRYVLDLCGLW